MLYTFLSHEITSMRIGMEVPLDLKVSTHYTTSFSFECKRYRAKDKP